MNYKRIPATNAIMRRIITGICLLMLAACQPATPLPAISAQEGEEFILSVGQSAQISGTDLTLTLISVPSDGRCPLDIECTESGPVIVQISIQSGANAPQDLSFNTFTDNNGNVPDMDFQGMTTRIEHDGYVVRIKRILPFPQRFEDKIKAGDYQIGLIVTRSGN